MTLLEELQAERAKLGEANAPFDRLLVDSLSAQEGVYQLRRNVLDAAIRGLQGRSAPSAIAADLKQFNGHPDLRDWVNAVAERVQQ